MQQVMKRNSKNLPSIRTTTIASALAGAAIIIAPAAAGAQVDDAPDVTALAVDLPSDHITVVDETAASNAACISHEQAFGAIGAQWQVYPASTDDAFTLTIYGQSPLCSPTTAYAAIYKMPNGGQWPQQLVEQLAITLQNPGKITISFAKECDRVQFDLVTGTPPQVLNTGFDHQLLFPWNLGTALQYFGTASKCQTTTTTTTTSTTAAPTTTVAPPTTAQVLGTTTIPSDVLSATTVPSNTGGNNTSRNGATLAATGSSQDTTMALVGAGLVAAGGALVLSRRRSLGTEA